MTNQLSTQISNINKTCTNGKTKLLVDNIITNTHKNGKQKRLSEPMFYLKLTDNKQKIKAYLHELIKQKLHNFSFSNKAY